MIVSNYNAIRDVHEGKGQFVKKSRDLISGNFEIEGFEYWSDGTQ